MSTLEGAAVLVTGADGFIGSHLVERLVVEGAQVRCLASYNPTGSFGWLDELDRDVLDQLDVVLGDLRDPRVVEQLCHGRAVVYHLAALISIPYSYQAPASYFETNVMGTVGLLEAALRAGVSRFVHTSTSEVYGTPGTVPITEAHPLQAQSPYSASKIAADMATMAWWRTFGLPVVTVRPFNTYGPRQSTRAVIPTLLGQLLRSEDVELGSLLPRRDFCYVSDTVDGFVRAAAQDLPAGELVQLATGVSVSIGELAELAASVTGRPLTIRENPDRLRPPASEVWELVGDASRARSLLGWEPQIALEEGLRRTAGWLSPRLGSAPPRFYR